MSNRYMIKPFLLVIVLMASACTDQVALLDRTTAKGDAFSHNLTEEYRKFSKFEAHEMVDWRDAGFFAEKGLAAAQGEHVKPERPEDWRTPAKAMDEMKTGYRRLVAILETGVRSGDPRTSAKAQARFDCWIEQQEENWQKDHIAACKSGFVKALTELEASPEVQAARFTMVLFPHDSARLINDEIQTMASLIKLAADFGFSSIEVAGHTDRRGTEDYNMRLSRSRADAVRLALVMQGIPPALVKTTAYGEARPRVTTADGIQEPLNRRVEILVRKPEGLAQAPKSILYSTAKAE
jgi:OmpA-OmpF porin, OOP family